MRYLIYIPILLLSLLLISCTQEISPEQSERFVKFYGSSVMDEAKDIEVLDDGSFAICGIDSLAGESKRAVLIVTDEYGNVKSGFPQYYFEGGYNSVANTLIAKDGGDGGFLLAGYVDRPQGDSIQRDIFLVRTTASGRELWKRIYGSANDEAVLHATEMLSSGGFMLSGYQVKNGKKDVMVMGVTDQGDSLQLGLRISNPSGDATANYIFNTGENYLCVCTYETVGNGGTDILVLNFDEELSPNYKVLGKDSDEIGKCIVKDDFQQYLVLGDRKRVSGNSEIVVYLIETSGLLVTKSYEVATISEAGSDMYGKRMVKMEDGRFAIVGTKQSGSNKDLFLQFLTPDYQASEMVIFGSAGDQSGVDIGLPIEGGILLLGTNGENASSMISLIRTDDMGDL